MNNAKFDLSTLLPIRHNQPQTNKKQLKTTLSTANSSTPSTANTKKIGNYLLGKQIGQGTFGKVHLALHIPTNEKVAVKIIDKNKMRQIDIRRVQKQIYILKKIHHRHVVQLYQIIETEKSVLFFQEHLPNGELFKEILKKKRLTQLQASKYFQQIISALQYLHKNKIAHRDLKPENILIDFNNEAKIIDFGLSTQYSKKDLDTFCGSPCYAAPQIVQGKKGYSPFAADLWSCGVILFTMIAGYLPFCEANVNVMFKKILSCTFKMPDFISPSAVNLIENLLTVNPSNRMSIKQIKNHEWFNQTIVNPAYGINNNEYIPYSSEVLLHLQKTGIDTQYFKDVQYNKNMEKNRFTASYFILMKKLIRNEELIPEYISYDHFNPHLILKKNDKIETSSDTQSVQIIIGSSDIPTQVQSPPEAGTHVFTDRIDKISLIDNEELIKIIKNIYDFLFNQFFKFQNINRNSLLKQKSQKLKQNEFYKGNLDMKKVLSNINQAKQTRQSKEMKSVESKAQRFRIRSKKIIIEKPGQLNKNKFYTVHKANRSTKSPINQKYSVYLAHPIIRIQKSLKIQKLMTLINKPNQSVDK